MNILQLLYRYRQENDADASCPFRYRIIGPPAIVEKRFPMSTETAILEAAQDQRPSEVVTKNKVASLHVEGVAKQGLNIAELSQTKICSDLRRSPASQACS